MTDSPMISLEEARRRQSAAGVAQEVEPPRPLIREVPEPEAFPVGELGDILAPAALAIHDRVQAPLAICAQSVLAAATLAVQAHADVVLPIGKGSQVRPISNYFVSIAASGERKSACDTEATRPIREREAVLREAYQKDLFDYRNEHEAWKKAREKAVKAAKGDRSAIKQALDKLGAEPTAPLLPLLLAPEPTFEGLCKLFDQGQPSLGLFSAEGGQFIAGHAMSPENKLRSAAGFSNIWDGEPIRRVRAADDVLLLPGRRLSAHLMCQPEVAGFLLGDRMLEDQGLLSRLLVSAPASTAGTRFQREEKPKTEEDLARYARVLKDILETPLPLAVRRRNEVCPRPLPMEEEAQWLWLKFADHVERQVGPGGDLAPVRGIANKLPEHAARLAGVLTLTRDIRAEILAEAEMKAGIVIAQYYAREALRLFGRNRIDPMLLLAEVTRDWIYASWCDDVISLPDLYQLGPNRIREKKTAKAVARILVDHGNLEPIPGRVKVAGTLRRGAFRIVRG